MNYMKEATVFLSPDNIIRFVVVVVVVGPVNAEANPYLRSSV